MSYYLRRHSLLVATVLITLLGSGIRFHNLGGDSLWLDEILTINVARGGVSEALNVRDHPPLFYWLTLGAIHLLDENEFALRLPSLLAGIVSLPLLVTWGRVSRQPIAGLWAAFLLALSPFHLRYTQEARHYALLMMISVATYIFLYLALTRGKWRWWLFFGLSTMANLYTHYSAFLVLAAAISIIAIQVGRQIARQRQLTLLVRPFAAGVLILLLYIPWLPRLATAIGANLGPAAAPGTTGLTSLSVWLKEAFYAFGFATGPWPFLAALLCLTGLLTWAWQRRWLTLMLSLLVLILPFFLIITFQVARWAFPKYIIYLLPVYLLAIGVAVDHFLSVLAPVSTGRRAWVYASCSLALASAFFLANWHNLAAEYAYVERDWRGLVAHLVTVAEEGDIFVPINLDLHDGFNQGGIVMPYYLDQVFEDYTIIDGNHLALSNVEPFSNDRRQVWVIALNRVLPLRAANSAIAVEQFAGSLYLIHPGVPGETALAQLMMVYENMIPATVAPSPQCLLRHNLATLQTAAHAYETADQVLAEAKAQCPERGQAQARLQNEIDQRLLAQHLQNGRTDRAQIIAYRLLQTDAKDEAALAVLTVVDLWQQFVAGEVQVDNAAAPEPVQTRRYTMPSDGDWGDVLLVHPPAAVTYTLQLPTAPTALLFRMAMAPESWVWGGDGSTFIVRVTTGAEPPVELFRQHIGNQPADWRWHEGQVSLADYMGQVITLTLTTEAGPENDTTGDWAGWESPRIIWDPAQ